MSLLSRYLLKELVVPLVVWVSFLFLLLFVMQFLRGSDVILGSSVSLEDLGQLIVYLAPHFLMMALPVAFLLAILLGLGRLSEDRELTALQSLGIGPVQLLAGPLAIGAVLAALMVLITSTAEPWGLTSIKTFVAELIKKNVVGDVKSGVFYEDLSNLTLYAETVNDGDRRWTNVLLHDDREPSSPLLMLARNGQVNTNRAGQVLTLELGDGEAHRANQDSESYSVVTFKQAEIAVGVEGSMGRRNRFRSPKEELTPSELLQAADEAERTGGDPKPFLNSLYNRLGQSLAPISFALLGTPLAIGRRQGGRAWGYLLSLGGYVAYHLLMRFCEQLGLQDRLPLALANQLANIIFCTVGLVAMYRVSRAGTVR